jgi:peptide deformylase
MILPIHLYGHPALRRKAEEIDKNYPELEKLISDMFATMYKAEGIGLAAPQVGKSIRLLIIDTNSLGEDDSQLVDFKRVVINPKISPVNDDTVNVEEGCLSIPGIRENVVRYKTVKLDYYNENFEPVSETLSGFKAIVVQHEFDHLEGKLFTDRISSLKKHFVNKKLNNIKKKKVVPSYKAVY